MKTLLSIFCLTLFFTTVNAQYYLRGEIRDEKNIPIPNAKILLHSTKYQYSSGSSGAFGIMTANPHDSITISLDGYQTKSMLVDATQYQQIVLKMLFASVTSSRNRLVSVTKNLKLEDRENWTVGGETYSSLLENEFVEAKKFSETGFAIHTDKASYSNIRRFMNMRSHGTSRCGSYRRSDELF